MHTSLRTWVGADDIFQNEAIIGVDFNQISDHTLNKSNTTKSRWQSWKQAKTKLSIILDRFNFLDV